MPRLHIVLQVKILVVVVVVLTVDDWFVDGVCCCSV